MKRCLGFLILFVLLVGSVFAGIRPEDQEFSPTFTGTSTVSANDNDTTFTIKGAKSGGPIFASVESSTGKFVKSAAISADGVGTVTLGTFPLTGTLDMDYNESSAATVSGLRVGDRVQATVLNPRTANQYVTGAECKIAGQAEVYLGRVVKMTTGTITALNTSKAVTITGLSATDPVIAMLNTTGKTALNLNAVPSANTCTLEMNDSSATNMQYTIFYMLTPGDTQVSYSAEPNVTTSSATVVNYGYQYYNRYGNMDNNN